MKKQILAICGESAAGKDTLLKRLSKDLPVSVIVSHTSRPMREGEVDGVDYHFTSEQDILKDINDFLEIGTFNAWYYGTKKESLSSDKINIGVFNPDGIAALTANPEIEVYPIYISVPENVRLSRALLREANPDIDEIFRRRTTDMIDFDDIYSYVKHTFEPSVTSEEQAEKDYQDLVEHIQSVLNIKLEKNIVVVYDSLTGQTARFAKKLGIEAIDVIDYKEDSRDILLATRSYDFGQVPSETEFFLEDYSHKVVGTVVSGNRNWGTNYGEAGRKIEKEYNIPIILIFEGSGFTQDVTYVKEWLDKHY